MGAAAVFAKAACGQLWFATPVEAQKCGGAIRHSAALLRLHPCALEPSDKHLVDAPIIQINYFEPVTFGDEAIAKVWQAVELVQHQACDSVVITRHRARKGHTFAKLVNRHPACDKPCVV